MTGLIAVNHKKSKRFDVGNGWMTQKKNPAFPERRGGVSCFSTDPSSNKEEEHCCSNEGKLRRRPTVTTSSRKSPRLPYDLRVEIWNLVDQGVNTQEIMGNLFLSARLELLGANLGIASEP
jgi:hypothetical protein